MVAGQDGREPTVTRIEFDVFRDDDADVYVATSKAAGITTEAATRDGLIERLRAIVPDVLESRAISVDSTVTVAINWQQLVTDDRTELAVP